MAESVWWWLSTRGEMRGGEMREGGREEEEREASRR